jgi:hypothetical protein
MYKRILLASDGARESLVALREGALMAQTLGAQVFLLIVDKEGAGLQFANAAHPIPRDPQPLLDLLALGLDRLKQLGVEAQGDVRVGEPALVIAEARAALGLTSSLWGIVDKASWTGGGRGPPAPIWSTRSPAWSRGPATWSKRLQSGADTPNAASWRKPRALAAGRRRSRPRYCAWRVATPGTDLLPNRIGVDPWMRQDARPYRAWPSAKSSQFRGWPKAP